jgi:hypothetical protein
MGKNPRISPLLLPVFLTNQPQKPGCPIASFAMGAPALRLCFCLFFPPTSHKSPGAPSRPLRWVGITDPSPQQRHCFSSPASNVLSATHRIGRARIHACQKNPSHRKGTRSRVPKKPGPKALPLCRRPERSPKGEATQSIAFAVAVVFSSAISAQKSHVKPQNHLTHYPTATSAWHVSYPQTVILDI